MKLTQRTALLRSNRVPSFNRNWSRLLLASLVTMLLSLPAVAQSVRGTVSGIVTDSNGAAIPGAAVALMGDQKGDVRNDTTNDSGRFSFNAVQPGNYTLKILLTLVGRLGQVGKIPGTRPADFDLAVGSSSEFTQGPSSPVL